MFPLFGMHFRLMYALLFLQSVFRLQLPLSKPIFSHGALHTDSAYEQFARLEALYKCLNTIQHNNTLPYQLTATLCRAAHRLHSNPELLTARSSWTRLIVRRIYCTCSRVWSRGPRPINWCGRGHTTRDEQFLSVWTHPLCSREANGRHSF